MTAFIEKTHNDDDHGSECGQCEQLVAGDVVVIEPRPSDAPLCFCCEDCAQEWLDEARKVARIEARGDYAYERGREVRS